MRTTFASMTTVVVSVLTAAPAFAQDGGSSNRPWHYWIAPFILAGGVLLLVVVGARYYFRVMSGRPRQ